MDNHRERIANFKIEPPGLFRGRGNHPKMGMLKRRIMPEDIIINCSKWVQFIVWARNQGEGVLCSWEYFAGILFRLHRTVGNNMVSPCTDLQVLRSYWLVMWRKHGSRCSAELSTLGYERSDCPWLLLISRPSHFVIFTEMPRFLLLLQDINGKRSDMITRLLGWSPGQRTSKVPLNISC